MATITAANRIPAIDPKSAGEILEVRNTIALPVTLALNDVIATQMYLPPGCVPVQAGLVADDLDDGTALVLDVGISGATAAFIDGSTVGQAGGVEALSMLPAGYALAPTDAEREILVLVQVAAGTPVAGDLTVIFQYRAAQHNE